MTTRRSVLKALPRLRAATRPAACQAVTSSHHFVQRGQSTCTMDLVNEEPSSSMIFSTLQYVAERDIVSRPSILLPPPPTRLPDPMEEALRQHPNTSIAAEELDLVQAAERRQLFDKVLLLVQHGQEAANGSTEDQEEDPESLSGRGTGQALSLSRRMAAFCNTDTHLTPELVIVAPLKKVLQTTFLAFPYETPHHSVRNVPWICHPQTLDWADTEAVQAIPGTARELQQNFPGVDYSLMQQVDVTPGLSSEAQLLQQADSLLEWLQTREERVVVVSGDAAAINAFGCRLNYQVGQPSFCDGELRAYGLHYTQ